MVTTPEINSLLLNHIEKDDLIQIVPTHKWGGCIAVVDEPKSFGCQAYVTVPGPEGSSEAYIRLDWNEFEPLGIKAIFVPEDTDKESNTA